MVEFSEVCLRISSGKLPIDGSIGLVASLLPRGDSSIQLFAALELVVHALATENAQFDLSHIQPATMLRCVMEL